MDHSSFTEAQQQQQYQEHQQAELAQQHQQQLQLYQQHQNQDYSSQPYDPSQVQAYDQSAHGYDQSAQAYNQSAQAYNQSAQAYNQSAQAYYPYYQYQQPQQSQHPQQHQQQQQQQYQYYQPDYGNVYQQPAHQQQPQQELGPVQPPGVPVSHEVPPPQSVEGGGAGSGHGQLHVQHQQNAYYPQGGGEQQSSGFPLPPGLNPAAAAAVAALSQLTQFAGTMDAAERAMAGLHGRQWHGKGGGYRPMMGPGHGPGAFHGHGPMHHGRGPMRPPAGRSPYRGGGRRGGGGGGGPFRGGGRGNFGPRHPFRGGGSGLPFRGRSRGRGRGGSRRFAPYAASSSSHPESAAVEDAELPEEEGEPSGVLPEEASEAVVLGQTSPSMVAPGDSAPNWQPSQVAWCELCRVDCTSLEILEQHKNGKRHKKNLQRIEELKSANLTGTEISNEPEGESKFQTEIAQEGEEESDDEGEESPEKNLPSEAIADQNKVVSEQKNDIVEQPEKPMEERSDSQVGKPRMEHFDNWRRGMKRRMRGGRGGKRMKMFEAPRRSIEPPKPKVVIPLICDLCNVKCDTQEVFDRHLSGKKHIAKLKRFEGHQAMYGPMGLQALYPPNPIAQTLLHPQGHQQQGYYGPPGSFPPQGPYMPPQAHQAAPPAAGAVTQSQQNAIPQGSEAHPRSGSQAVVSVVHEPQQQFARVESGNKESVTAEMNHANGISESGSNGLNPPQDNTLTRVEQVYAATHEAAPLPDYGVTADHVSVPGLDIQPKEGAAE